MPSEVGTVLVANALKETIVRAITAIAKD